MEGTLNAPLQDGEWMLITPILDNKGTKTLNDRAFRETFASCG